MKESEHMQLICPVMTQFVADALNGNPFCAGSACALWRWADGPVQVSDWIAREDEQKALLDAGWKSRVNSASGLKYTRPYPDGERPGHCGLAKEEAL